MRTFVASLCVLAVTIAPGAMAQPADPLRESVQATVDRFEQAYRNCGLTPAFSPAVEIRTHPSLISYSNAGRKVVISRHQELPEPLRLQLDAWAADMGLPNGAALFETIFQRLGTAHEMGHWQQHVSGRSDILTRWDSELEANRIAIAFRSTDPTESATLAANIENWLAVMGRLLSPVPRGDDARDYFEANYRTIVADAAQYGWFQGEILRQAWARRDEADFCDLSRLNAPAPIEAFAADRP